MLYYELTASVKTALSQEYEEGEAAYLGREVVRKASGLTGTALILVQREIVPAEVIEIATGYKNRLVNGEPWQYITGEAEFFGHTFSVGPGVLIPRPETELLVEEALKFGDTLGRPVRVLDACTGSGCIAHSIALARPTWEVSGFDISVEALSYAQRNKELLGSKANLFHGDLLGDFAKLASANSVDILVSNPPYVPLSDKPDLAKHVRDFEPEVALFAPEGDALLFYRRLVDFGQFSLSENGILIVEIYSNLINDTLLLFQPFESAKSLVDFFGKSRIIIGNK